MEKSISNPGKVSPSVQEVAERFNELAQQEKWFEIQEEFFSDDVESIEHSSSPWMKDEKGKAVVRTKAQEFIKTIEAVHSASTTQPVIGGNYFAVGRDVDLTIKGHGRVEWKQIMLYEVKDGKIVSEQFFY